MQTKFGEWGRKAWSLGLRAEGLGLELKFGVSGLMIGV